jgi:hypothetical protein
LLSKQVLFLFLLKKTTTTFFCQCARGGEIFDFGVVVVVFVLTVLTVFGGFSAFKINMLQR